jgi:hypothetical protein
MKAEMHVVSNDSQKPELTVRCNISFLVIFSPPVLVDVLLTTTYKRNT